MPCWRVCRLAVKYQLYVPALQKAKLSILSGSVHVLVDQVVKR